jgi:hypothetical protein
MRISKERMQIGGKKREWILKEKLLHFACSIVMSRSDNKSCVVFIYYWISTNLLSALKEKLLVDLNSFVNNKYQEKTYWLSMKINNHKCSIDISVCK